MSTARMKLSIPRIFELQWLNVPLIVYTTLKISYRVEGGGGGELKTVVKKWNLELPFARLAEDEDCKKVDDRFSFSG